MDVEKKHYWFAVPAEEDGWLWFVCCQCPYLMKMNIETEEIFVEAKLPGEPVGQFMPDDYVSLIKEGEKIIMFPHWGIACILEYDCTKKQFSKISVPGDCSILKQSPIFNYICKNEDYILGIGEKNGTIIQFDKKTGKYNFLKKWFEKIQTYIDSYEQLIFGKAILVGEYLYIPFRQANAVIRVDIQNEQSEILEVGNYNNGWCSISYIDKKYWLLPVNKPILVCWDIEKNIIREIELGKYTDDSLSNEQFGYYIDIVEISEAIYLFPFRGKYLLKYNWKNDVIDIVREEELFLGIYCGIYENERKIWSFKRSDRGDKLVCISKITGKIKEINFNKFELPSNKEVKNIDYFKLKQMFINNH